MIDNYPNFFNPGCPMMGGYPRPMAPMYSPDMMPEMYPEDQNFDTPLAQRPTIQPYGPTSTGAPDFEFEPGPPVTESIAYTQGFLETQIGRYVKVDFLIGTNLFIDREGILEEVGISYIVLREAGTGNKLMCDIYSIKFVEIFENGSPRPQRPQNRKNSNK